MRRKGKVMPRYIDAEPLESTLLSRITELDGYAGMLAGAANGALKLVQAQPAADVAPVVHAEWIDKGRGKHCSNCEAYLSVSQEIAYVNNFCPKCGASMKGRS